MQSCDARAAGEEAADARAAGEEGAKVGPRLQVDTVAANASMAAAKLTLVIGCFDERGKFRNGRTKGFVNFLSFSIRPSDMQAASLPAEEASFLRPWCYAW